MAQSPNIAAERELTVALLESLATLPGFTVHHADEQVRLDGAQADLLLTADVKGQRVCIPVEAKAAGFPRDVRAAAWQLERVVQRLRDREPDLPVAPLVVAPAISESARAFLRDRGIGYWDLGGSLYLDLPQALYVLDRPPPKTGGRRLGAVYRGRAAQVLHALLHEPGRPWHVDQMAAHAEVSVYTVHQVFTFLEDQLWVEKEGKGPHAVRVLRQPGALLDAWADAHSLALYRTHRYHRWARETDQLLGSVGKALDDAGVEHALTLDAGARLVAPFTTGAGRLAVLVADAPQLDRVAAAAGLHPADEGDNVAFLATRDGWPLLFRRRIDGAWVASDVQLYLDLWASPARGREQARHLRAERLGY